MLTILGAGPAGSVRIREQFAGTYVLHCHIVAHEDRGRMQMVRVLLKVANPKQACVAGKLAHH